MKWFSRRKLGTRLIVGYLLIVLVAVAIGGVGIFNLYKIDRQYSEMHEKATVPLGQLVEFVDAFQRMRGNVKDILLSSSAAEISQYELIIDQRNQEFNTNLALVEETLMTDEGHALVEEIRKEKASYDEVTKRIIALAKAGNVSEALSLNRGEGDNIRKALEANVEKLTTMKVDIANETSVANSASTKATTVTMIIILASGVLAAAAVGAYIFVTIQRSINTMAKTAKKLADGDLDFSLTVYTKDSIGQLAASFNEVSDNLNEIMSNIQEASEQVASGSRQVSESSMSLSQGATEQASSIEQLTASIEEIAAQTRLNAQNANQANELADLTKVSAIQGNDQMKSMLKSMDEINEASNNISKIIKVIDEIAFQTNILALNAAVEAARAGQHGKGFAVVAEEVRNLAARSANAAKETTTLIEGSIHKVAGGTKIANETASALAQIVESIEKVSDLVGNIAVASNEQATGVEQVNQGVSQIASVVQTTSATSEETAAASEELSSQAEMLKEQVSKFKLRNRAHVRPVSEKEVMSPEMIKMIESMKVQNRQAIQSREHQASEVPTAKKIVLSEKEFGKYS
ncbi:MAG: HAMP domain-containing protein [Acidaminobacter sp.]|uniref:methyl-accepting chemotaxis protein n=1 Tax=Acidaminobacter sp. TaxID=1872102 RepID=UPI0013832174|nr:methyl-accepting chemotaxis protein [Acidaminobacter sp.]MZQ99747.1 HAMP domain-containing protein [Acidaminobacter sp.]